jgi:hypothetical protein
MIGLAVRTRFLLWCALWSIIFAATPLPATASCLPGPGRVAIYDGTIGAAANVRMVLSSSGNELKGIYFYTRYLKDIRIEGNVKDLRTVLLREYDSAGRVTARFVGEFADHDPRGQMKGPLGCEVITGTWEPLDSARQMPFYLRLDGDFAGELGDLYGRDNDGLVNRAAQKFQAAVIAGDQEAVAALILYPIDITVDQKRLRIKDRRALALNWERIFSSSYREAVAQAVPRAMFANEQGIMLGSGQAWFNSDGKIIAINP